MLFYGRGSSEDHLEFKFPKVFAFLKGRLWIDEIYDFYVNTIQKPVAEFLSFANNLLCMFHAFVKHIQVKRRRNQPSLCKAVAPRPRQIQHLRKQNPKALNLEMTSLHASTMILYIFMTGEPNKP